MNQTLKPNVGKLQNAIKHVVVLMLENRSFDNLLGWLYAGPPPYDRPLDPTTNCLAARRQGSRTNPDLRGGEVSGFAYGEAGMAAART